MSRTIQLTPRLRMVADLLPRDVVLVDVGTDHAYLPAVLLLEGKIRGAIAADLRPGPLNRASYRRGIRLGGKSQVLPV